MNLTELKEERSRVYNQKYQVTREYERMLETLDRKIKEEVLTSLPQPIWKIKTTLSIAEKSTHGWSDVPEGEELIDVREGISNIEEIKQIYHQAKVEIPGLDRHNRGIKYWRINGVMLTSGGGTHILRSPQIVSDDCWEELKKGRVSPLIKKYDDKFRVHETSKWKIFS